ncbi:hypothetical protein DV701_13445 [Ornithinimicrobium avium]|uniref:Uncharacterized protein n=1 Tax=Ornithinimicrobium avium TaxID=2283195 RepID=A0A345NPN2_9MICO|nr:hypothetical protein DV701_13445 [Ornithinimicrobium avium]
MLVVLVLGAWILAAVAAGLGLAPRAGSTTTSPDSLGTPGDGPVVVVGVPGLTWDLVDEDATPALHALAGEGGSAALVLRGTYEVTCSADAWLTVGAGQRAATDVEGCADAELEATPTSGRPAPVLPQDVVVSGDGAAVVDESAWDRWTRSGARSSLPPQLGALAAAAEEAGTCVAAYDPLSALGAADGEGRVAAYLPQREALLPTELDPGCSVHLMSTPSVTTPDREVLTTQPDRAEQVVVDPTVLSGVDAAVGELADRLPVGSSLVVAGLGHPRDQAVATTLIVHPAGSGPQGATLTSGSTRQRSLVQLTDLTPTVLVQAGIAGGSAASPLPTTLAGAPVTVAPGDDGRTRAQDLAAAVSGAKTLAPVALGVVAVLTLPVLVLALLLRRHRAVAVVGTLAMAVPVATWLAGLVPWWRADRPSVALTTAVVGAALLVAGTAWAGPWRRDPLGPPTVVAAVTLVVIGADTLCSARLGLVSVLGLQPVTAGRFYGQGNVGFGTVLGAFLVLAAAMLTWLPTAADRAGSDGRGRNGGDGGRRRAASRGAGAAVAVLLLGAGLTVVNAAPSGGADFGGVPAMVVATGLLALYALGQRWSVRSLLTLAVLGVLVAAVVMVLDWLRGPQRRTHLGAFVQQVVDGHALGIVTRKLDQSLGILISYPLSWLAVLALVLVAVVVVRRPRWSAALWEPAGTHPAALAGVVAMVLGWVLNDSGIAVVALALAVLIGAALAVLGAREPWFDQPERGR